MNTESRKSSFAKKYPFLKILNLRSIKPKSSPRVTVFIPTYNRLEQLKATVCSVFRCGESVHLHILDNQSSDGTREWIKRLKGSRNVSIEVTLQKSNIGGSNNFLCGFNSVRTEFVVPLADDDELVPGFLNKAIAKADLHPDVIAVIGARAFRDGRSWRPHWDPRRSSQGCIQPHDHIYEFLTVGHYTTWSACLWRTSFVDLSNLFSEATRYGLIADVFFQFRLFLQHPCYLMPIPAATFNRSAHQASSSIGVSAESIHHIEILLHTIKQELKSTDSLNEKTELFQSLKRWKQKYINYIEENRKAWISSGKSLDVIQKSMTKLSEIKSSWGMLPTDFD